MEDGLGYGKLSEVCDIALELLGVRFHSWLYLTPGSNPVRESKPQQKQNGTSAAGV